MSNVGLDSKCQYGRANAGRKWDIWAMEVFDEEQKLEVLPKCEGVPASKTFGH